MSVRQTERVLDELATHPWARHINSVLWAGVLVLMAADIVTTVVALPHPWLIESNAVAAWFIAAFGAVPGLTIKMGVLLAVTIPLYRALPVWARPGLLTGLLAAHLVAVATNVELLLRFGVL